jgi:hypothetical protein
MKEFTEGVLAGLLIGAPALAVVLWQSGALA